MEWSKLDGGLWGQNAIISSPFYASDRLGSIPFTDWPEGDKKIQEKIASNIQEIKNDLNKRYTDDKKARLDELKDRAINSKIINVLSFLRKNKNLKFLEDLNIRQINELRETSCQFRKELKELIEEVLNSKEENEIYEIADHATERITEEIRLIESEIKKKKIKIIGILGGLLTAIAGLNFSNVALLVTGLSGIFTASFSGLYSSLDTQERYKNAVYMVFRTLEKVN